jgi:hypothetical protein
MTIRTWLALPGASAAGDPERARRRAEPAIALWRVERRHDSPKYAEAVAALAVHLIRGRVTSEVIQRVAVAG